MKRRDVDRGVRAYREVLSDGLLDMLFGLLVLVVIGYATLSDSLYMAGAVLFVVVLLLGAGFEYARRRITYRRIVPPEGTAELERGHAIVTFGVLLALLVGAGLPFVAPRMHVLVEGYWAPALLAAIVMLVAGTVAISFSARRFWLYAVLFGGPALAHSALEQAGFPSELGYYFGFSAVTTIVIGGALLLRFVRRHPLPPPRSTPSKVAHA